MAIAIGIFASLLCLGLIEIKGNAVNVRMKQDIGAESLHWSSAFSKGFVELASIMFGFFFAR